MKTGEINPTGQPRRVLVLDEEFPYPLNSGKRIRSHNLLKHLAGDFSVDYLAYGEESSEKANALRSLGVTPVPVRAHSLAKQGFKFYLKIARSLFSPDPYIVSDHFSQAFQAEFLRLTKENQYDLIVAEWTPYAKFSESDQSIPHLIVAHNIEWRIWEGYLEQESHFGKRLYIKSQIRKLKSFEISAWKKAAGVVAVSEVEAKIISQNAPTTSVTVVENGVDIGGFSPSIALQKSDATPPTIVFVGALDWRPNQDAVRFLIKDIIPKLETSFPDLQTVIVGRNPSEQIMNYASAENIEIAGSVPDVRPYMKQNSVFVVPLRIGGGSRLKILEAAAMKMAIVTTTRGADGLSLSDGKHYLQADDPEKFAENIVRLLSNTQLRQELGSAAQKYVQEHYDWSIIYWDYKKFIGELMGRPSYVENG